MLATVCPQDLAQVKTNLVERGYLISEQGEDFLVTDFKKASDRDQYYLLGSLEREYFESFHIRQLEDGQTSFTIEERVVEYPHPSDDEAGQQPQVTVRPLKLQELTTEQLNQRLRQVCAAEEAPAAATGAPAQPQQEKCLQGDAAACFSLASQAEQAGNTEKARSFYAIGCSKEKRPRCQELGL